MREKEEDASLARREQTKMKERHKEDREGSEQTEDDTKIFPVSSKGCFVYFLSCPSQEEPFLACDTSSSSS
jgi:hypothetical protein